MHELLQKVLQDALLAMGTLLATALVGLVATWAKKHGVELTQAQHDFLMQLAQEGIAYAEEKATSGAIAKDAKLEAAIDYVTTNADVSRSDAHSAIHAALPDTGKGATAPDPMKVPGLDRA